MNEQSIRMSAYNYAKWFGKKTGQFDANRVDRALSYLMSGKAEAKFHQYGTTVNDCDCPDHTGTLVDENNEIKATWTPNPYCKHIIARMIQVKMDQLKKENGR